MLAVRVAIATVALIACAWFALGIHQARDQAAATTLINQPGTPSPALTRRILSLLDSAGTLNPDRNIDLMRAQAEVRGGEGQAALREALAAVRAEPLNVDAWIVLGIAAGGGRDPAAVRLANIKLRQLAPPVAPAT
jgi:hypothetical protein